MSQEQLNVTGRSSEKNNQSGVPAVCECGHLSMKMGQHLLLKASLCAVTVPCAQRRRKPILVRILSLPSEAIIIPLMNVLIKSGVQALLSVMKQFINAAACPYRLLCVFVVLGNPTIFNSDYDLNNKNIIGGLVVLCEASVSLQKVQP